MKEIKDDTNRWNNLPCSWIGKIDVIKMTILPKAIYRFSAICIKLSMTFFTELEQKILQFVWKHNSPIPNSQGSPEEERWSWSDHASRFQTILQSYRNQNRNIDQRNRTECPEINPGIYGQLIYDKDGKTIQWRRDCVFNKW